MASPAPPGSSQLIDEAEALVERLGADSGAFLDIGTTLAEIETFLAASATGEVGVAAGATALAGVSAASGGIVDLAGVAVIVLLLILALMLGWLEDGLAQLIPPSTPWIGSRWAALVHFMFSPVDQFRRAVARLLAQVMSVALVAFRDLVHWALFLAIPQPGTPLDTVINQWVEPVHHEVDTLWSWVQQIAGEVTNLRQQSSGVGTGSPGGGGVPGGRLDQLEQRVATIETTLTHVSQQLAQVVAQNAVEDREIATLRSIVYGVRAASVGAQDVFTQLDRLRTTIESVQAQQGTLLSHHTAQLTQLEPLLTLLYLGRRGLDNLRKLENNPCQCPRLPGFNPLELDAFGVYEFLTNG